MQEKENVMRILQEAKDAIKNNDSFKLKDLSDQTIHTASITQDPDNIAVAVAIYSLSKIVERRKFQEFPGWGDFYKSIISTFDDLSNALRKKDDKQLRESLALIQKIISKLSGALKIYIQDVFRKAQINKASKIYEHGISMEKTAHLLGVSLYELASYAGQKPETYEVPLTKTLDVKSRIKLAEDMFK
ncbi:MAG: hypothetical protein AABX99_04155 [Nanoarchaeota archaeon]